MRARGCLLAMAVLLALLGVVAAVFGPGALRRARQAYAPISRMKGEQREFEAWVRQRGWRETATPALTAEKLDRFLALRRDLRALDEKGQRLRVRNPEGQRARLKDMPEIIEAVGELATERFQDFRRHDITPAEYDSIERLVYDTWLPALVAQRSDPDTRQRAAAEIDKAAQAEPSTAVRARLRQIAAGLREQEPAAPDGVPPEIHRRLLARAAEIEGQPTGHIPARVPRPREERPEPTPSP
jgi:hypothetical protein